MEQTTEDQYVMIKKSIKLKAKYQINANNKFKQIATQNNMYFIGRLRGRKIILRGLGGLVTCLRVCCFRLRGPSAINFGKDEEPAEFYRYK